MPDIRPYPWISHLRAGATEHVIQQRAGTVVRSGVALTFWFRPGRCALSHVPAADQELPLLFHARTGDYQDATIQATVSYRLADPEAAARRIDFSVDPGSGRWRSSPLDQVGQLLTELAQQHALDVVAAMSLAALLAGGDAGGIAGIRRQMARGLTADHRLLEAGLAVIDVRIVAVRPDADVERALQTPARELMQGEADRATYERRALAVERERAISENELQSRIELAAREETLVVRQGAAERRRAEEAAAAGAVRARSEAESTRLLAAARAEAARVVGEAEGTAEAARMAAYAASDPGILLGLALREAAANLPQIGSVTVTPDVVTRALQSLAPGGAS